MAVGLFLKDIIADLQPQVTLEIGMAYGISSLFILEALRQAGGAKHYAIDPNQATQWLNIGVENIRRAEFGEMFELLQVPAHLGLATLEGRQVSVDFAFIDGYHTFDHTLCEFFLVDKLLKTGGVIVFDDANWPAIRKVCRFAVINRSYRVLRVLDQNGKRSHARSALDAAATGLRKVTSLLSHVSLIDDLLKPELSTPDEALGLSRRASDVALVKCCQDERKWDHFVAF
ncbi:MAG: class I SAM-dependent methyltransferase [Bryobacteraceae bacterium]